MLNRLVKIAALALMLGAALPVSAQTLFRPVAVVNDSAITGFDLAQRAQILVALGFTSASPDALRAEALDQLVEDRLKLQAGEQIGISRSEEIVRVGLEEFARVQNLSVDEYRTIMSTQGVSGLALEDMVAAEIIWLQVVRARFQNRVTPGEAEIDAELGLIAKQSAFDYRIQEIGLPLEGEGRTEAQTRALGEQLYSQLNDGGDFDQAVAKFSRAPSAAGGGNVGWVTTQRMPPDLLRAITELDVGQVSRPLPVAGGLSLVRVLDKRPTGSANTEASIATREQVRSRLINQRSERLAEGLLQELRRDALIEVR